MYLKSLVLHGFKSFAQRVDIRFSPGVSAVVGPNGSGKSNISDAIRWVLGEQSARQLRGTALQDVIFAGTDQRRPLGMAAVSLTLDNTDGELALPYTEITVTRRVYRSGESEFFINGTACRLRDIHELFMDTGLGRGSMAIIGQGEVDAVLSARPEERRALIEEVAGITRYRTRRKEAMQRLEQTDQNLIRLVDIITEIETNLEPLEREAEKATRYREWSDRLRELEITLLYQQWAARKRAWEARQQEASAAEASLNKVRQELEQAQHGRKAIELQLQDKHRSLSSLQDQAHKVRESLNEQQTHIQVLDERIVGLEQQKKRYQMESERLRSQQGDLSVRLDELQKAKLNAISAVDDAKDELQRSVAMLDAVRERIATTESALTAAREQAVGHLQAAADARSQTEQARIAKATAIQTVARLEKELEEARSESAALATELASVEERLSAVRERQQALGAQQAELQETGERQRAQMTRLVAKLDRLRTQQSQTRSRRDALAELETSLEGFNESVRACLRANEPWRSNVFGAVGTLLEVPGEYEGAMETALGGAMQNVVVANQRTAEQAIEYLKRTRAGRVTFLPLDALRKPSPPHIPLDVSNDPDFIGIGSELVQAPAEVAAAVQFLLARVLVARDLRAAIRLMRQVRHLSKAVSLDGDLVLASGPITGGHRPNQRSSGVLSRSHRIRLLDADLLTHHQARAELESQHETAVRSIREVETALQALHAENAQLQDERIVLERQRDVLRERIAANQRAFGRAETERTLALEQQQAAEAALRMASEKLAATDSDQSRLHLDVANLEQELQAHRAERERLEELRSERQAAWSEAESQLSGINQEVIRSENAVKEMQLELQRVDDEVGEVDRQRAFAIQERKQISATMVEAKRIDENLREQEQAISHQIGELTNQLKTLQKTEETCRERLDHAAQAVHKLQLALEKEGFALEQIESDLTSLEAHVPESVDSVRIDPQKEVAAEAKRLRRNLDQLGHVNLNALDEFAALQERYRFLINQKEDLLQAKEDLEKAIREFDTTSRTRLQDSLGKIQKALDDVFPRLFGGGRATLGWTDPEDPLESGIDIMVQPKAKRPQALLTLSGGERSLAATALLFAIMTVRPSPFFVLDEIDAALDERNLERFASLMREFGERNQIIVITHRQATMEVADTLFGVTMERQGASQLVSLQLNDAKISV